MTWYNNNDDNIWYIKPIESFSDKEVINKIKQLDMMPLIYRIYKYLEEFRRENINNQFISRIPDQSKQILNNMRTEKSLILMLDRWEKNLKRLEKENK